MTLEGSRFPRLATPRDLQQRCCLPNRWSAALIATTAAKLPRAAETDPVAFRGNTGVLEVLRGVKHAAGKQVHFETRQELEPNTTADTVFIDVGEQRLEIIDACLR